MTDTLFDPAVDARRARRQRVAARPSPAPRPWLAKLAAGARGAPEAERDADHDGSHHHRHRQGEPPDAPASAPAAAPRGRAHRQAVVGELAGTTHRPGSW